MFLSHCMDEHIYYEIRHSLLTNLCYLCNTNVILHFVSEVFQCCIHYVGNGQLSSDCNKSEKYCNNVTRKHLKGIF